MRPVRQGHSRRREHDAGSGGGEDGAERADGDRFRVHRGQLGLERQVVEAGEEDLGRGAQRGDRADAAGVIAYDSVRPMPMFWAASSSNSAFFSLWSGLAG